MKMGLLCFSALLLLAGCAGGTPAPAKSELPHRGSAIVFGTVSSVRPLGQNLFEMILEPVDEAPERKVHFGTLFNEKFQQRITAALAPVCQECNFTQLVIAQKNKEYVYFYSAEVPEGQYVVGSNLRTAQILFLTGPVGRLDLHAGDVVYLGESVFSQTRGDNVFFGAYSTGGYVSYSSNYERDRGLLLKFQKDVDPGRVTQQLMTGAYRIGDPEEKTQP